MNLTPPSLVFSGEVTVIVSVSRLRCGYCHDSARGLLEGCLDCGAVLHTDCRRELGRCSTLGCHASSLQAKAAAPTSGPASSVRVERAFWDNALFEIACFALVLGTASTALTVWALSFVPWWK